jgi:hypothetical protein
LWQIGPMSAATDAFSYLDSRTERSGDEVSADEFRLIADKLQADPSLLRIPLENIERWLSLGHSSRQRLEQWRAILLEAGASKSGMHHLLRLLCDESGEAVHFKAFAPFPGILSSEELNQFQWTSAH